LLPLQERSAIKGTAWNHCDGRCGSLRVLVDGLNKEASSYAASALITRLGICDIALDTGDPAGVMLLRSGTSLTFCAARA
jgi:hypothetical protein